MIIHDNQRCCEFCSAVLNHNSCLKSCLYHNSDIPWVLFSSPFNTICLKSCLYHNSITSPISQFHYSKMSKAIYRDGGKTYSTLCHILAKVNSHQSPPPPPHTPQTVQNTDIISIMSFLAYIFVSNQKCENFRSSQIIQMELLVNRTNM